MSGLLENIYDMLGNITRELIELKLGMIKTQNCEIVSQEEVDEYLELEEEELEILEEELEEEVPE